MDAPHRFTVGDRVRVHGGYDGDYSDWLRGGDGYRGTIRKLTAEAAAIELDDELVLDAPPGANGWVEQTWADPVRLQVGLCEDEPDLYAIPRGGGIGYWVESHAAIAVLSD